MVLKFSPNYIPSRVVLHVSSNTTRNLFNHNVRTIIKMDAVLAQKNYFSIVVNRKFTLLLPGVAHLIAIKTIRQILNKCFQTRFRQSLKC